MVPWIQVYSNLCTHPKTCRMAEELGLYEKRGSVMKGNVMVTGLLVSLWSWCAQNCPDGELCCIPDWAIAEAAGWTKKPPEIFVKALLTCRFLDENRHIHDWEEHASLFLEAEESRKEKTRERVAKCRARKKEAQNRNTAEEDSPKATEAQAAGYCGEGLNTRELLENFRRRTEEGREVQR